MPPSPIDARIAGLAAVQHGVFTRAMAEQAGATAAHIRARLAAGRWRRMHLGVYQLAGSTPSWRQELLAAVLSCGSTAVASHLSAGALWSLPGVRPGAIEVSVPRGQRIRTRPFVVHQARLSPAERATFDSIPITTPARTLIDLAATVSAEEVEVALDDALRRRLVTIESLRRRVRSARYKHGVGIIRDLVAARDPRSPAPQSPLETKLLTILRRAGLPEPERQFRVGEAGRVACLDFAWPNVRVAVETDGYRYHAGRAAWESDRARSTMLTLLGWRVIHVTWRDLADGAAVAERIRRALQG